MTWCPMQDAPSDEPVMLKMRDSLGTYECGPFARDQDGIWKSHGGRYQHPLIGAPIAWRPLNDRRTQEPRDGE